MRVPAIVTVPLTRPVDAAHRSSNEPDPIVTDNSPLTFVVDPNVAIQVPGRVMALVDDPMTNRSAPWPARASVIAPVHVPVPGMGLGPVFEEEQAQQLKARNPRTAMIFRPWRICLVAFSLFDAAR